MSKPIEVPEGTIEFLEFLIDGAEVVYEGQKDEPIEDQISVEDIVWNLLEDRRECDDEDNKDFYEGDIKGIIKWFETEQNAIIEQIIKDLI